MYVPASARVESANFINALAGYDKHYRGVVKTYVTLSVASDRLWRLENRILPAGWPVPAESRRQIMRESTAKADSRPIPPLPTPPETPDYPGVSNCWRPVEPPPLPRPCNRAAPPRRGPGIGHSLKPS